MPFSTGFYGEYTGVQLREQLKVPMSFYVLNFTCAGFVNYLMWVYITNPKNKVAEPSVDPEIAMLARIRSLTVPSVFVLMLIVGFLTNVIFAVYIPILIPIFLRIIQSRVKKKFAATIINQNN